MFWKKDFFFRRSFGKAAYLCQCLITRDTPYFLQSIQEGKKKTVLTQEPTKYDHSLWMAISVLTQLVDTFVKELDVISTLRSFGGKKKKTKQRRDITLH